jgi:SHS2 domain-containing protein
MLFGKFEISIENGQLQAKAWGEKIDVKKHSPSVEVKAATYADLKVEQDKEGSWSVQCIIDV